MCTERLFSDQIANFSYNYDIFVADISRHVTIAGSATDILKKAPQNFVLIGLSMGGIVAMEIARVAQKRISSLILIDTNPFAEKNFVKKARLSLIKKTTDETLGYIFKICSFVLNHL